MAYRRYQPPTGYMTIRCASRISGYSISQISKLIKHKKVLCHATGIQKPKYIISEAEIDKLRALRQSSPVGRKRAVANNGQYTAGDITDQLNVPRELVYKLGQLNLIAYRYNDGNMVYDQIAYDFVCEFLQKTLSERRAIYRKARQEQRLAPRQQPSRKRKVIDRDNQSQLDQIFGKPSILDDPNWQEVDLSGTNSHEILPILSCNLGVLIDDNVILAIPRLNTTWTQLNEQYKQGTNTMMQFSLHHAHDKFNLINMARLLGAQSITIYSKSSPRTLYHINEVSLSGLAAYTKQRMRK